MSKIDQLIDFFNHSKQIDLLSYYRDIANSHRHKLILIASSMLAIAQLFIVFPIQYWGVIEKHKIDFIYFLLFSLSIVFFMVISFVYQLANFLSASTNRVLTEANHLIHYYEDSHESLISIDHALRDGESYTKQMAKWAIGFIFAAAIVFIIKLVQLLVNLYGESPTLLILTFGAIVGGIIILWTKLALWSKKVLHPRMKDFQIAQDLLLDIRSKADPEQAILNAKTKVMQLKPDRYNKINKELYKNLTRNYNNTP